MIKKNTILRLSLISLGTFLALIAVFSVTTNKAHAALVLDPTTTSMLVTTISATGNLVTTVQLDINAGQFSPSQSSALSATLGGIGSVLANISSIIGGITLPNTGFPPYPGAAY